jgi:glycerol-3-phosphate cytidylyltransferase
MFLLRRPVIGYTSGVFDLFHVGHLNLLIAAKSLCDRLVVGVSTDELVAYKHKKPVIPFDERIQIVRACSYVDVAIAQESLDKVEAHKRLKFDSLFVGDDWHGDPGWVEMETNLIDSGVKIHYFPYTRTTSSTLINQTLIDMRAPQVDKN